MKKIIAILSITVMIFTVLVVSCYAEEDVINTDVKYEYISATTGNIDTSSGPHVYVNYKGNYKGTAIYGTELVNNIDINFVSLNTNNNTIQLTTSNNENYIIFVGSSGSIISNIRPFNQYVNGYITFTEIGNIDVVNNYFKANITYYSIMNNGYNQTNGLIKFTNNTISTIVTFMVTNSVILIFIAIVIVSISVGVLKRIKNKD